jgi:hypothetical protein
MTDSALIMISTTYNPHCETFRFAWRKIGFVFTIFGPRRGPKRSQAPEGLVRLRARCGIASRREATKRLWRPSPRGSGIALPRLKLRFATASERKKSCAKAQLSRWKRWVRASKPQAGRLRRPAAPESRPNKSCEPVAFQPNALTVPSPGRRTRISAASARRVSRTRPSA